MPKYTPTHEDMYNTNPCFICGRDVLKENEDTYCEECRMQKEMFEEDWMQSLLIDFLDKEEENDQEM